MEYKQGNDAVENIFHGTAHVKMNISDIELNIGDFGYVTAYLPMDNIFSVYFSAKKWITFKMSEEEFLNIFNIKFF